MSTKTANFRCVLDLAPYLKDQDIIAYEVCYDGTLAVLTTEKNTKLLPRPEGIVYAKGPSLEGYPPPIYVFSPTGPIKIIDDTAPGAHVPELPPVFRLTKGDQPYNMTLLRIGSTLLQKVEIRSQICAYPKVQVFPDESILVSQPVPADVHDKRNASIYSKSGELDRHLCLGPFKDVQVAVNGDIWVSYSDYAILSEGWPGLSCFNKNGQVTWSFKPRENIEADFGYMYDCDTMNVFGDTVWACYFEDYPVVCIDKDKSVKAWRNQFDSVTAIAVDGAQVLSYERHGEPRTRCMLQSLGTDGEMHHPRSYQLVFPDDFNNSSQILGRGSKLHTIVNSKWYCLGLDDLT